MRRFLSTLTRVALCVLFVVASYGPTRLLSARRTDAVAIMAKVLLEFTHVPTLSQQAALQGILEDAMTTRAERLLASAVLNIEHIVSRDDRARLATLVHDDATPADVKTLATILIRLTHTLTEADRAQLRPLAQRVCPRHDALTAPPESRQSSGNRATRRYVAIS